jgi:putative polyhydroxyalkanoate system protein
MPKTSTTVSHTLGEAGAIERLKSFAVRLKEKHQDRVGDLTEDWNGNVLNYGFSTFGFKIKGTMNVTDNEVKVDTDLPFAAMMFKGKIEQEIRETLTKVLA